MAANKEIFGVFGPSFLIHVDWNNSNHRRSIAASLVQGVYVLEGDRTQNRNGPQALAPPWWMCFDFRLLQVLIDDTNGQSIIGAVYEFYPPYPILNNAPKYVIAFRGKITKSENKAHDLKMSLNCLVNNLEQSKSFEIGLQTTNQIVSMVGPGNVWLAGHSIGSTLALLIGRHMAKNTTTHIETYLFNPPFASPPIERIKNEKVKLGLRFANSVVTAGLAVAANGGHRPKTDQENDTFSILSSWIPYLFVNQSDMISSEYIGYFEHRERMNSIGVGKIGKLATKHSIGSIVSSARGKDSEPVHLIPSAYITINSSPSTNFREDHGIHQWWKLDLEFKYKLYQYK